MKKRCLFLIAAIAIVCLFALSVSAAEIPEWSSVTDVDIEAKSGFDTTSRVLLSNGDGTYSTYLTNYIINGTDTKFSVSNELDFTALSNATGKDYTYASVVRMEIPTGFTEIEARALRKDKGFTSMLTVKIPEGVTKLGQFAFYNNDVIVEVELPESLETIDGGETFIKAKALEKINIPSKITTIPSICFSECTSLTKVTGCAGLTAISDSGFKKCPLTNTDVSIFSNVTTVGAIAFYNAGITSISLPKATSIGSKAFANCPNLTTVLVGPAAIGDNAFDEKCPITSLTLNGTLSIGANAFRYIKVERLVIPDTCTSIGSSAFAYGYYKEIVVSDETKISSSAFTGHKESVTLSYVGSETIDASAIGLSSSKTTVSTAKYCDAYNNGVHTFGSENIVNDDNFFAQITITNDCVKCGDKGAIVEAIEPLFVCKGYTISTFGEAFSMAQGFTINNEAIAKYKKYVPSFEFGLIAAGNASGGEFAPDLNSDWCVPQGKIAHDYFDIKITGITKDYLDTQIIFCAYVKTDEAVYYLDNYTTSKTLTGISYSSVEQLTNN